jgi:hypothetical protein
MNELIKLLGDIERNPEITKIVPDELADGYEVEQLHPMVQQAISSAEELLIRADGQVDYRNVVLLERVGYQVRPGETDSFGWLSGCIQTTKGVIVFG